MPATRKVKGPGQREPRRAALRAEVTAAGGRPAGASCRALVTACPKGRNVRCVAIGNSSGKNVHSCSGAGQHARSGRRACRGSTPGADCGSTTAPRPGCTPSASAPAAARPRRSLISMNPFIQSKSGCRTRRGRPSTAPRCPAAANAGRRPSSRPPAACRPRRPVRCLPEEAHGMSLVS